MQKGKRRRDERERCKMSKINSKRRQEKIQENKNAKGCQYAYHSILIQISIITCGYMNINLS
jgi:hypothetical protein